MSEMNMQLCTARKNGTNKSLNNKASMFVFCPVCLLLTMPGALVPTNRSFESVRRAKRQKMNGLFQSVSRNPGPVTIKEKPRPPFSLNVWN